MAVTLPALLLAYDFLFLKSHDKSKFKRFIPHLLFLIPLFFYFLIRHYAVGFGVAMKMEWDTLPERLLHLPALLIGYLKLMVFPFPMTIFHRPPSVENFPFLDGFLPLIVLAILISISIYFIRNRPIIGFSLLWFGLTLFPVLNLIPINFAEGAPAVAERYAYIPSIGASILLAWFFLQIKNSLQRISPFFGKIMIGLLVIILLSFSIIIMNRNTIFKSDFSLFEYEAHQKDHGAFISHFNYASLLEQRDRLQEAEKQYLKAIALRWDDVRPYLKLGKIYERMENLQEAFRTYQLAVTISPGSAEAHMNLGFVLIKKGEFHESELPLKKALELNSNLIKAHRSIGFLYYNQLNQANKALFHFQQVKKLNPKADPKMDKALSLLLIDRLIKR